jgi:hypothetical protein
VKDDSVKARRGAVLFGQPDGQVGTVITVEFRAWIRPRHLQDGVARATANVRGLRPRGEASALRPPIPGVPEAGVGITHFVFGPRGSVPSGRQTLRTRTFLPLLVTVE